VRLIAAIFALSSFAPSAKAEVNFRKDKEARADIALLQSCYEAAESWDQARGCINLTFDSCMKPLGKRASHADEGACNNRELGLWQHLLDIEQRKIEAWAVLKDNQIVQTGQERPDAHHTAIEERDVWNAYAEAQCQFEVAQYSGGTIGITEVPHCSMRLTVKRLFDLRAFLASIAGKPVP
jgi:uncharacterized protein YecT (DUF1311 family)